MAYEVTDAADWSPAAFLPEKPPNMWRVSYKNVVRHAKARVKPSSQANPALIPNKLASAKLGNIDSRQFFAQMHAVQTDTKEHWWRCRVGAERSNAREEEEPSDFCTFLKNINVARQLRDITRSTTPSGLDGAYYGSEGGSLLPPVSLPGCLSHLSMEPLPSMSHLDGNMDDEVNEDLLLAADRYLVRAELGIGEEQVLPSVVDLASTGVRAAADEEPESARCSSPSAFTSPYDRAASQKKSEIKTNSQLDSKVSFTAQTEFAPPDVASKEDGESALPPTDEGVMKRSSIVSIASSRDSGRKSESWDDEDNEIKSMVTMKKMAHLRRFKNVVNFSKGFEKGRELQATDELRRQRAMTDQQKREDEREVVYITDHNVAWLNLIFALKVETEFQFQHGYPIILLMMLDAIYPKKVPWHRVEWHFNYKHAGDRNYGLLQNFWTEVGMEKTKLFRQEYSLEIGSIRETTLEEKFAFLRLMRSWFDSRIHFAPKYDPIERRYSFATECLRKGYKVDFPSWIPFDRAKWRELMDTGRTSTDADSSWNNMPEFRRFVAFLGQTEVQEM